MRPLRGCLKLGIWIALSLSHSFSLSARARFSVRQRLSTENGARVPKQIQKNTKIRNKYKSMKERVGMEIRDEQIFTLINKLASKLVLKSLLNELVSWLRWTRILSCLTHWVHLRAGVINRLTRLTRMCSLCRLVWHPPTLPFSSKWAQPSVMT